MYKQNYCSAIFAQNPLFVWKAEKEGQPENSALPGYFILQNYDAYVFAIIAASSLMEDLLTLQKNRSVMRWNKSNWFGCGSKQQNCTIHLDLYLHLYHISTLSV